MKIMSWMKKWKRFRNSQWKTINECIHKICTLHKRKFWKKNFQKSFPHDNHFILCATQTFPKSSSSNSLFDQQIDNTSVKKLYCIVQWLWQNLIPDIGGEIQLTIGTRKLTLNTTWAKAEKAHWINKLRSRPSVELFQCLFAGVLRREDVNKVFSF